MAVFKKYFQQYGVLYPLQTFSKNRKIDFKKVPICIEGSSKATEKIIFELANKISGNVQKINSEKRKVLHLAAVFANNFQNHLYTLAKKITDSEKINFSLLLPLIEETTAKIKTENPIKIQTGPAARKDKKTMEAHLKMLKNNSSEKEIYKAISKSIAKNT